MNNVFFITAGVILAGLLIIILSRLSKSGSFITLFGLLLLIGGGVNFFRISFFEVDEGMVFVKTRFGKISGTITESGINWKWPWEEVHGYPSRLEAYTSNIQVRSQDGMSIGLDFTVLYRVEPQQIGLLYKEIARDLPDLQTKIYPDIRMKIRDAVATFTARNVYVQREELPKKMTEETRSVLAGKYVFVDSVIIRNISLPEDVETEMEVKIIAQQQSETMQYRQEVAEKEARIKEIEAKGIANAQKIINDTLSAQYLQHEAIQAYRDLAKSSNATFVIMPTDPKTTGVPLILNTGK